MKRGLEGSVVVITGASSGIGRACALRFAALGTRLMLCGRNRERLGLVLREVRDKGVEARSRCMDITDQAAVCSMVAEAERELGPVDVAVASAGRLVRARPGELRLEDVRASMEVNFFGVLNLVLAVLPGMLSRRAGHIVAISSVDGKKGLPLDAPYVAAKFAVTGLFDSLRQDLRNSGVHLGTVLPGRVDTPMIGGLDVPWISRKIPASRVAAAVERAIRGNRLEVIVPYAGPKTLILAGAISPRLADGLIRLFRLEGSGWNNDNKESATV
jgi:NADP-dependent 3-hydroxy acid dehydrogenase YdfG